MSDVGREKAVTSGSMTKRVPRRENAAHMRIAALAFCLCLVPAVAFPQGLQKEQVKQQAEAQLQQMSPAEIEAKIKELGMTRQDAETQARELGIDLNTFLQRKPVTPSPAVPPAAPADTAKAPSERKAEHDTAETKREGVDSTHFGPGGVPYFGYSIFGHVPAAFEPTATGPVDPEYLIGPGDALKVTVWGQVELQNELVVDRDGRIFIPTVGQVLVSGVTLRQAQETLKKQMSRSYSGLLSDPPTVWLDVTLARLKPKRVFIMGEVEKPGGYTVSSYATVFNTLYSIGGPTVRGSLRDVRVLRGNKLLTRVDFYDYLTGADQTNDVRVQNDDIIFVPPRGKTVTILGEVRRPAIFELLAGENLKRLLDFAGGALSSAYFERVQVDRVIPFSERTKGGIERRVLDVDFRSILNENKDFTLEDGDSISVFSILEGRQNVVLLTGSVVRPGYYELEKTPTIRSLIQAADGLLPRTYLDFAHLVRYNSDLMTKRIIRFNLREIMENPSYDGKLQPRDEVIIYSTEDTEVKKKVVTIRGEVKRPGEFSYHNGMTLQDLVILAGGYTEAAEVLMAEVSRIPPKGFEGDSLAIIFHPKLPVKFFAPTLQAGMDSTPVKDGDNEEKFFLEHRDEVFVLPNPNYKLQQNILVEGDVIHPGVYAVQRKGERLSSILGRAGGPTKTSYMGGGQLYRGNKRLLVNFVDAYYGQKDIHDVIMAGGDRIFIPSRPYTVLVEGEVNKPGLLSFLEGQSVRDYIDRAGGFTDSSSYALLIKPSGESRRVDFGWFRSDPEVPEGSVISVLKVQHPPPEEKGEPFATTVKDIIALVTSAATLAFIIYQVTK